MAKPIIVMKIENALYDNSYERLKNIETVFARRFEKDYYFLAVPLYTNSDEPVHIEVHYEKNFNQIKYEELKVYIKKLMDDMGTEIELNRDTLFELLRDHPPMLSPAQIDMWKAYGSYNQFATNPSWEWNMDKLKSMDSHALLRLHNEIESFK